MTLEKQWQQAIEETKISRFFRQHLSFQGPTAISYIFLGESTINIGDTVVRKGKVIVDQPLILLPKNMPQFSGFDLEEELGVDQETLRFFLMVRGVHFPSLKYQNQSGSIDIFEDKLEEAIKKYQNELTRKEDLTTGLITGPSEYWQLSILIYVTFLISRSASGDLEQFLDELRRRFLS